MRSSVLSRNSSGNLRALAVSLGMLVIGCTPPELDTTSYSESGGTETSDDGSGDGDGDGSGDGDGDGDGEEAICGNGVVEGMEECDEGAENANTGSCTVECLTAICGDGFTHDGVEECDEGDGNDDLGACTSACTLPVCGDGFIQAGNGEACDDGENNGVEGTADCLEDCTLTTCGDAFVGTSEACDDGEDNGVVGASDCKDDCTMTDCGDGFVGSSEACDDANGIDGDGCSSACELDGCAILPPEELFPTAPFTLLDTGLYEDIVTKTVASDVRSFAPKYTLWTDGAAKNRWISLPACVDNEPALIDTTDMDGWTMPIGTKLWKEFVVDGKRVETRIVHRFGPDASDFLMASYEWNETETQAYLVPVEGAQNVKGTNHDIPSLQQCLRCHGSGDIAFGGYPGRWNGFSAVQLSHEGTGVSLEDLINEGLLSNDPPMMLTSYDLPGTAADMETLGYLHANCGHCHNSTPYGVVTGSSAVGSPSMALWSVTSAEQLVDSPVFQTANDVNTSAFSWPEGGTPTKRIQPGDHTTSAIWYRMSQRDGDGGSQMPPIGTEVVHQEGLDLVSAWIDSL